MGAFAYLILILLVGGALTGLVIAGAVIGGVLVVLFMIGFLLHEIVQWMRGKDRA